MKAKILLFFVATLLMCCILSFFGCTNRAYKTVATDQHRSVENTGILLQTCQSAFPLVKNGSDTVTVTVIDTIENNSLQKTIDELNEYILATSNILPADTAAIAAIIRAGIRPTVIEKKTTERITDTVPDTYRIAQAERIGSQFKSLSDSLALENIVLEREKTVLKKKLKNFYLFCWIGGGVIVLSLFGFILFKLKFKK